MPASPASATAASDRDVKPSEVIMAPRSGAGLRSANPGQGVEPRSPRSERGVLPVRRSRKERAPPAPAPEHLSKPSPLHPSAARGSMQVRGAASVSFGRGRTMFSKPLANPSALDRRSFRHDRVLRGGALEPDPRTRPGKKSRLKHTLLFLRHFPARTRRESFSLRRGLNSY